MLVINNGRVIDPATNTDRPRDILIDGDKIAEVAEPGRLATVPGRETFDAAGLMVARAGAGIVGNDRDGNARGGARWLHRSVLHAEHQAGE